MNTINKSSFEDFTNYMNEIRFQMPFSNNTNNGKRRVQKKNTFSIEEDEHLKYLVNSIGQNWELIVKAMKKANFNKNIRQCRDRYFHYLDPNINNNINWSQSEDENIFKFVETYGKKWKMMEQMFPGRTEVSLRNRYNLLQRKFNREQKKMFKTFENPFGNNSFVNENEVDFNELSFEEINCEDIFNCNDLFDI